MWKSEVYNVLHFFCLSGLRRTYTYFAQNEVSHFIVFPVKNNLLRLVYIHT